MENIERALYTLTYALRSTRAGKDIDYIEVTEEGCGRRKKPKKGCQGSQSRSF